MTTLGEHLAQTVHARWRKLGENEHFATATDPVESLHDLRVASRRLRAFVDVFEPVLGARAQKRTGRPLRRITRAVRSLRDWDVQMGLAQARLERASTDAERAALEHLLEWCVARREAEARRTAKRFSRIDLKNVHGAVLDTVDKVVSALPSPGEAQARFSWDLVLPFVIAVEQAHESDLTDENVEQLHALRIDAKRLRYALELFEPLLGERYTALHRRIRRLQELLGDHHDLFVLDTLLGTLQSELEQHGRRFLLGGTVTLRGTLAAERSAAFAKFVQANYRPEEWREGVRAALGADSPVE